MAGTGHPVISPEELVDIVPELVVVMNPVYRNEIERDLEDLGLTPEVIAV